MTRPSSVTVEQFAAVQAAEQDDLPIDEALAEQGLDRVAFEAARPHLLAAITESASTFKQYDAALAAAQDALFRPIEPLYDDAAAWLAYNAAIATGTTAAILLEHGLTLGDLARLDRAWRPRFVADPGAAREAKHLAEKRGLVPIKVGERTRFGTSATPSAGDQPVTAAPSHADLFEEAERLAVAHALLEDGHSADAFRRRGFGGPEEARDAIEQLLDAIRDDADLVNHFRRRAEHARRLLLQAPAEQPSPTKSAEIRIPPPPPAVQPLDQTAPALGAFAGASLPFHGSALPPPAVASEVAQEALVGETAFLDA
ncbi:MAG: hypothetical protein KC731_04250, partial [Myxococcales bacterium]|nr:hypothetical protein [Myxococcales bacterium]